VITASLEAQEEWEKGDSEHCPVGASVRQGKLVGWADEMRLGLLGRVGRVWGIRGIQIRPRRVGVECTYQWRYLFLAVDGVGGPVVVDVDP
jgi:hypothetical protein